VALVTPALQASGGIGRAMSYLLHEVDEREVVVRIFDTRGRNDHQLSLVAHFASAYLQLVACVALRRIDVVHVNIASYGSTVRKAIVVWTCRMLAVPVVLHLHGGGHREFYARMYKPVQRLIRRTFQTAQHVVVLGESWKTYVCETLGVDDKMVTVLANAVGGPEICVPTSRAEGKPLKIVFLGRLSDQKGVPDLLTALASPELRGAAWTATVAGDGDASLYRAGVAAAGLNDRIRFPGWLGQEAARLLLSRAHVLVLPSYVEGLPIAVLEALAHAVPVIATHAGALADVVEHHVNGIVVSPGDSDGIAEALLRILDDEPYRAELARNARLTWEERFAVAPYARRLETLWSTTACNN
jgi:glycosyltransferase involved in cell wall biosynthesis